MRLSFLSVAFVLALGSQAAAHVALSSGPAAANKSQKITFGVGHGCEIAGVETDTFRIRIDIPEGVTSVRALRSEFGKPRLIKEAGTGKLLAVEWQKPVADLQPEDFGYYEITLNSAVDAVPPLFMRRSVSSEPDSAPKKTIRRPLRLIDVHAADQCALQVRRQQGTAALVSDRAVRLETRVPGEEAQHRMT